jgi:pilus assembly protein CpaF
MQEVRGIEADAAIDGASRGATGLLMTYHLTDPTKVCEQLAQHIVDEYPNRKVINETRRVAQTLHVGATMKNLPGNQKKVTSAFEICYDYDTDKAWINYFLKYNTKEKKWEYNAVVSESLLNQLDEDDLNLSVEFQQILSNRATESPMKTSPIQPINFKEEGVYL